jgi:hypothetical protein
MVPWAEIPVLDIHCTVGEGEFFGRACWTGIRGSNRAIFRDAQVERGSRDVGPSRCGCRRDYIEITDGQ